VEPVFPDKVNRKDTVRDTGDWSVSTNINTAASNDIEQTVHLQKLLVISVFSFITWFLCSVLK